MDDSADPVIDQEELADLATSLGATRQAMEAWLGLASGAGSSYESLARRLRRAADLLTSAVHELEGADLDEAQRKEFRGSCEVINLPDLMGLLANSRKSGVLAVFGETENFLLQLKNGEIVFAQSDDPPEGMRLGEILITLGAVARAQVQRALAEKGSDQKRIGALLRDHDAVDDEDLADALSYQIRNVFERLFVVESATFCFVEDEKIVDKIDVRLNVMKLLLESARQKDEESTALSNWLHVPIGD